VGVKEAAAGLPLPLLHHHHVIHAGILAQAPAVQQRVVADADGGRQGQGRVGPQRCGDF
jgi:hypothetical protein